MGIFDYNCYIENQNCPLLNSGGQEFTSGLIYAVNKKLTKKFACYYSGYGYAELGKFLGDDKIYDLIHLNMVGDCDINDKSSYFACPDCAKSIEKECNDWDEFYELPNPIDDIKENIEMYEKKLKSLKKEKKKLKQTLKEIKEEEDVLTKKLMIYLIKQKNM